jgi:hypothetical protein
MLRPMIQLRANHNGKADFVAPDQIAGIEDCGDYSRVVLAGGKIHFLVRESPLEIVELIRRAAREVDGA